MAGKPNASRAEIRLQVFLSRAGIASRRASEELILRGRVAVNGETVREMGTKVRPGRDRVEVDGSPVRMATPQWLMLNKPIGYVTTRHDPQRRRTVYDLLPRRFHSLFHVGRLDLDSEGLLLLTNDGEIANRLLHPRYGVTKEYLVDAAGPITPGELNRLTSGIRLEEGVARADEAEFLFPVSGNDSRLRIVLREGRNREVKRMLEEVGHPVRALLRKRFGPIELGNLLRGESRLLTTAEVNALRSLGREGTQDGRTP